MNVVNSNNPVDFDVQIFVPFGLEEIFSKRMATGVPIKHQTKINPITTSIRATLFEFNARLRIECDDMA
jgi:hypothetical protein